MTLGEWFGLFLAGLGFLICLGLSIWQMLPSRIPSTRQGRLCQAILGGVLTAGSLLSLLAIGYILDRQTKWSFGDFLIIFFCFVFPFQLIATVGIYLGFRQRDWMYRQLTRLVSKQRKDH